MKRPQGVIWIITAGIEIKNMLERNQSKEPKPLDFSSLDVVLSYMI